jgi:hypothetical protein
MNRLITWLDDIIIKKRWILHVAFWLATLLLYSIFFGRRNNNFLLTLFFVGLLMPVVVASTYFFNYYLIPRFMIRGRYFLFLLYSVYTILSALFLEIMVALLTFLVMAELRIQNMSPASVDIFFLLASFLLVLFLGVAIKMVSHWRQSKTDYQALMLEKIEMELRFLKAQLNPHFLFNTLNNLYFLSTEKSEHAPKAILALSEILDYVMRSGKKVFVPLTSELKQVENYIALELLRYEDRVQISWNVTGNIDQQEIGPMIVITLIENAFKHGVMPVTGKSFIGISLNAHENQIDISVRNSNHHTQTGNGIGLLNLKSQLDHLYHNKYKMKIDTEKHDEFVVTLVLNSK